MSSIDREPSSKQTTRAHCLTEWTVLSLTGAETTDLLNRLLTLNVKSLAVGQGDSAFLLNHRGRVKEVFWLAKSAADTYHAITELSVTRLRDAIDMFIFSEDVTLEISSSRCIYTWTASSGEMSDESTELDGEQLETFDADADTLDLEVPCFSFDQERLRLVDSSSVTHHVETLSQRGSVSYTAAQLESLRIHNGAPAARDYRGESSPLDISRRGISEGKGCYPGQEVIERTLALGKPARITAQAILVVEPQALEALMTLYQNDTILPIYRRDDQSESPKLLGEVTSLTAPDVSESSIAEIRCSAIVRIKRSAQEQALCMGMQELRLDVMLGERLTF